MQVLIFPVSVGEIITKRPQINYCYIFFAFTSLTLTNFIILMFCMYYNVFYVTYISRLFEIKYFFFELTIISIINNFFQFYEFNILCRNIPLIK